MYVFTQNGETVIDLNRVESFASVRDGAEWVITAQGVSGERYTMARIAERLDADTVLFWLLAAAKRHDDSRTVNLLEEYSPTEPVAIL